MAIVATTLILALISWPQQKVSDLLPGPVRLAGTVVDSAGNPVREAMIVHSSTKGPPPRTDAAGHFAFETDAPFVVIEKPGFRSQRIEVKPALDLSITLDRFPQKFPTCTDLNELIGMGFGSIGGLYFQRMKEIKSTKPKMDVDYLSRVYYIASQGKKIPAIWHGTGPLWGGGEPFDEDVWRSTQFEEVYYSADLDSIVDARGQLPDGTRWRNVGSFGRSASYRGVTPQAADLLDRFLDGACIVPIKPPK